MISAHRHRSSDSRFHPAPVEPFEASPPPRKNETFKERLARLEQEAVNAKAAAERASEAVQRAMAALSKAETSEQRADAYRDVERAESALDRLTTFAKAADARASELRSKLADPETGKKAARIEELRARVS